MERPMVLQQPHKNALEAVLRYMPMPAWPQDTTRAGFLAHRSGDPGVLSQLGNLARRFRGLHILECSACGQKHDDFGRCLQQDQQVVKTMGGQRMVRSQLMPTV